MANQGNVWFEPPHWLFHGVMQYCDSISVKSMRQVCMEWKVAIDANLEKLKPRTLLVPIPIAMLSCLQGMT
jgi:hypothetical protein